MSGVLMLSLSAVIVKVIGLIYKIPMLRLLGSEGMGYFNSAYEIYTLFCTLATTGLPVAMSVLISSGRNSQKVFNTAIRLFALEAFCLIGLYKARRKPIWSATSVLYLLFLLWMCIGLFYTPSVSYGIRVTLKFLYALLVILFSSAVVRDGEVFLKAGLWARWMAVLTIVLSLTHLSRLFPGTIWYATALAINYIVMCMFSLAMYYYGGRKKRDLWLAMLFVIPCILWVFRTSIMGTALAFMVFMFYRYKLRSLPFIGGILILFVVSDIIVDNTKKVKIS